GCTDPGRPAIADLSISPPDGGGALCTEGSVLDAGGPRAPVFEGTNRQADAPPPLSGGTLIVVGDGRTAVASDPDRDKVWVVDLPSKTVKSLDLQKGDQPGRLLVDSAGRAHVALRASGGRLTLHT